MKLTRGSRPFTAQQQRDLVFLLFSAGVFLFGVAAVSVFCVVCAYPATVSALG